MTMPIERLTDRERQILDAIAEGLENQEIGKEMFIGTETVKAHVKHLLAKLGARNRTHAVALAYHHGLLIPKP